jgi:hypothetical protein
MTTTPKTLPDFSAMAIKLIHTADQLQSAYGHLPSNEWPGPPGILVSDLREVAAALAAQPLAVAAIPEHQHCPTAPAHIWLQVDPECLEGDVPVYPGDNVGDVSWCWHSINDSDTLYVRADLAASPPPAPQREPLTLQQIEDFAKQLPWMGFRKDANDEYTIPVINPSTLKLIRLVESHFGIVPGNGGGIGQGGEHG